MAHNIYHQTVTGELEQIQGVSIDQETAFNINSVKMDLNDISAGATSRQLTVSADTGSKFNIQIFDNGAPSRFYKFTTNRNT